MVDRRLAADRGIDLRQDRGRDLNEVDPAHIDGAGKAGQVADDAAAQRDDHVLAVEACVQHGVENEFQAVEGFRLFAGRNNDLMRLVAGGLELRQYAVRMQRADVAVGHHDHALIGQERSNPLFGFAQKAWADDDLVGLEAFAGDRDASHVAHLPPPFRLSI